MSNIIDAPKDRNPYTQNYEGKFNHDMGVRAITEANFRLQIVTTAYKAATSELRYQNLDQIVSHGKSSRSATNALAQILFHVRQAIDELGDGAIARSSFCTYDSIVTRIDALAQGLNAEVQEQAAASVVAAAGL